MDKTPQELEEERKQKYQNKMKTMRQKIDLNNPVFANEQKIYDLKKKQTIQFEIIENM